MVRIGREHFYKLLFLFRIKLMAEGELKDMEQFFDDLSDSFTGTEPEVHKTSVVGKYFIFFHFCPGNPFIIQIFFLYLKNNYRHTT